jgi:hypothetical protein
MLGQMFGQMFGCFTGVGFATGPGVRGAGPGVGAGNRGALGVGPGKSGGVGVVRTSGDGIPYGSSFGIFGCFLGKSGTCGFDGFGNASDGIGYGNGSITGFGNGLIGGNRRNGGTGGRSSGRLRGGRHGRVGFFGTRRGRGMRREGFATRLTAALIT